MSSERAPRKIRHEAPEARFLRTAFHFAHSASRRVRSEKVQVLHLGPTRPLACEELTKRSTNTLSFIIAHGSRIGY
jgi:hypothetical protein